MQARKITDVMISEKYICSKIITATPKMYMHVIRTLQKENLYKIEIENLEEEMYELYRMRNMN